MINFILNLDQSITLFLKNFIPHNYFFDLFFSFFSLKGNAIFVWILAIIAALIFEERKNPGVSKKDKKFIITFILVFLTTSFFVEYPLKNLFRRQRPVSPSFNKLQLVSTNCPTNFSFPSGHAATAFAAATVIAFFDKKRRFFYYLIAFLIAYSRIYLDCHYFLDVFFGAIIGLLTAQFFLKILVRKSVYIKN